MNEPGQKSNQFMAFMRVVFTTSQVEISCEDCYQQVDVYVDMLRTGREPGQVLPLVKEHLTRCRVCEEEFKALISILEAQAGSSESSD